MPTIYDMDEYNDNRREIYGLASSNLRSRTIKTHISLHELKLHAYVPNKTELEGLGLDENQVSQREANQPHIKALAQYTVMGFYAQECDRLRREGKKIDEEILNIGKHLEKNAYHAFQPIVCNIRNTDRDGNDVAFEYVPNTNNKVCKIYLLNSQRLAIIDGQHRKKGFEMAENFLQQIVNTHNYPKNQLFIDYSEPSSGISESTFAFWKRVYDAAASKTWIAAEIHLGLPIKEEQQLFFDLNQRGKSLDASMANTMDHSNSIIQLVRNDLTQLDSISMEVRDKDHKDWHTDDGTLSMKDVVSISSRLILNKSGPKSSTPKRVEDKKEFAIKFWETIYRAKHFGKPGARTKTTLAQPVMLKALAKLFYDLGYGTKGLKNLDSLKVLINSIKTGSLDFSHTNDIWKCLVVAINDEQRETYLKGINEYMYVAADTNLVAGTWDEKNKWVRFGSRHNDIYQHLGDIIRCKIGITPRPYVQKKRLTEKNINKPENVN